jgi:hypothetical protein
LNTLKDKRFRESKPFADINPFRVVNYLKVDNSTIIDTFRYQAQENPVYAEYLRLIGCDPGEVTSIDRIPFLPVEFFKTHRVSRAMERKSGFSNRAVQRVASQALIIFLMNRYISRVLPVVSGSFSVIRHPIACLPCCPPILNGRILRWFIWPTI